MEDEDGYMTLGKVATLRSPRPPEHAGSSLGAPQGRLCPHRTPCFPCCLLGTLVAALALALLVCVSWLVAQRGQHEVTPSLELRRSLCPRQGTGGCQLCPTGWVLRGTGCYWLNGVKTVGTWTESREDCVNRGAELLMPGQPDELDFLSSLDQRANRYFWIGLWLLSAEEGWMWLNGSCLQQSRFRLSTEGARRSCGLLRQGRIDSENCSSRLEWIYQKGTTQL